MMVLYRITEPVSLINFIPPVSQPTEKPAQFLLMTVLCSIRTGLLSRAGKGPSTRYSVTYSRGRPSAGLDRSAGVTAEVITCLMDLGAPNRNAIFSGRVVVSN